MTFKPVLLASVALLALSGCGGKEKEASNSTNVASTTKSSAKASNASSSSPVGASYSLKGATELDVDGLIALLPEDASASYASAEFDKKIGATVITDLKFLDDEDGEGAKFDRVELYGVDTDAMKRVSDAKNDAVDAPFETIFQKVRLFGFSPITDDSEAEISIGAIEFDKLRVRQGGFDDAEGDDHDEDDNPARFFNSFDLAGLYFKDISVNTEDLEDGEEADGPQLSLSAPDLRFVGVGGGKLGVLIANDLNYELVQSPETLQAITGMMGEQGALVLNSPLKNFIAPGSQKASVKSFVWKGFDLSGLLEYGLRGEKPPLTAKNLVRIGTINAVGAETYVNGKKAYSSAKSTFVADQSTWLIPTRIRASSTDDVYNFEAYVPEGEEQFLAIVKEHGLDNIESTGSIDWDWDSEKGSAALKSSMDSKGFADFDLSFNLEGLQIEKLAAAIEAGDEDAVASLASFKGFKLKIADEKLLDTVFSIAGLQMGASGADLRQSAPAMIRLSGSQVSAMNPRISDYVDAVAKFVAEGGTLEINASPEKAVPLAALEQAGQSGPQTLPDILNLKVTHSK